MGIRVRRVIRILGLCAGTTLSAQTSTSLPTTTPSLTLTNITPSSLNLLVDLGTGKAETTVTFTGTGFTKNVQVMVSPAGVIDSSALLLAGTTKATAVFSLKGAAPVGTSSLNVWLEDDSVNPPVKTQAVPFNIGTSTCLEAIQSGGCQLRWEVDTTGVTGNGSQTNNSTTPNILVTLDYLFRPPKSAAQKAVSKAYANYAKDSPALSAAVASAKATPETMGDRFSGHLVVQSGYTQVVAGSKAQPTTGTCPNSSSTSCTIAAPQDAFVAQAALRLGLTTGIDNEGTFGEFGLGAHGSVAYLIPKNQILQSGGLSYISLSAGNQNVIGSYEATGHFRLGQLNHDKVNTTSGDEQNTSSLLFIEGGYQNNRGLQQLTATTSMDTRNRYVARFYLQPEIEGKKHTKALIGMEYSGGLDGGPHVVQIFFGTNLNAGKLLGK